MDLFASAGKLGITGMHHPSEVEKLNELALGKVVLEVGSFMGLSAYCMACVAESLTCVDTFKANSAGQVQQPHFTTLEAFDRAVSRYRNVTRYPMTSLEASTVLGSAPKFDMVFLDAMHTYDEVKADIERWYPTLKSGGTLAFHDYGHPHFPDVKRAVDEKFGPLTETVGTLAWMTKP